MKKLQSLLPLIARMPLSGLFLLFSLYATAVHAQAPQTPDTAPISNTAGPETPATTLDMTEGEVRKVDMSAQKITIRHGEIKNLDMPGMTMVFQVKDPALLDKAKAGDKVRFRAEKINGALVVTDIKTVK